MPTVPRLQRQVTPRPLPNVRLTAASTPESEGAGVAEAQGRLAATEAMNAAKTTEAIGDIGQRVALVTGNLYTQIVEEARRQADVTASAEMGNAFSDWADQNVYDPRTGVLSTQGKNALGIIEPTLEAFEKRASEIGSTAKTPEQKVAFERIHLQHRERLRSDLYNHVAKEGDDYRKQVFKAAVDNKQNEAGRAYLNPFRFDIAVAEAESVFRRMGPGVGLEPETIENAIAAFKSDANATAITNLLAANDISGAKQWFTASESLLEPQVQARLRKDVQNSDTRVEAQKLSDEIFGDKTLTTKQAQIDAIKTRSEGDVRDRALDYLNWNWREKEQADRDAEEAWSTNAANVIEQTHGNIKQLHALKGWADQPVRVRAALEARARDLSEGVPTKTDPAIFYKLAMMAAEDPDAFIKENLLRYVHKLDSGAFEMLTNHKASLMNAARRQAEMPPAPFGSETQLFRNSVGDLSPYSLEYKEMWTNVVRKVAQLEREPGHKPRATQEEIQDIIDNEILSRKTVSIVPGGWFGIGGVSKLAKDVKLEDIPAEDRELIKQQIYREFPGQPATAERIINWYLRMKSAAGEVK